MALHEHVLFGCPIFQNGKVIALNLTRANNGKSFFFFFFFFFFPPPVAQCVSLAQSDNGDGDTPSFPALAKVIRHVGKAGDDFFAGGHFADAHVGIAFSTNRMLDPQILRPLELLVRFGGRERIIHRESRPA